MGPAQNVSDDKKTSYALSVIRLQKTQTPDIKYIIYYLKRGTTRKESSTNIREWEPNLVNKWPYYGNITLLNIAFA
ncbi:hypothetical protein AZI86_12950 [Bdellovibrio bacteriovorus]|uniref:Uncharacterized protein n=1 Tax=Bdellovibrio bacteriovorus TaxID=959 RepID=A0A150WIW0_BDEBC|nr:hypothetical protein AZI86_12950 [Bdellovibrio bacteriovorus]